MIRFSALSCLLLVGSFASTTARDVNFEGYNPVSVHDRLLQSTTDETSDLGSIVDVVVGDEDLTFLLYLASISSFVPTLAGEGPLTVFAPSNAGLQNLLLGENSVPSLGLDDVASLLSYHVVAGSYMASDITDGMTLETLEGETIVFSIDGDVVKVNGSTISAVDIPASNGVIHKISPVLLPESVLTIDQTAEYDSLSAAAEGEDDLSTMAELLNQSGLAIPLAGGPGGPLKMTMFAPTDAAFDAVDLSGLTDEEVLQALRLHVVIGVFEAGDIFDGLVLPTLSGETIEFGIDGDVVTVNGQVISVTDITASNGLVHKLDGVVLSEANSGEPEDTTPDDTTPDDTAEEEPAEEEPAEEEPAEEEHGESHDDKDSEHAHSHSHDEMDEEHSSHSEDTSSAPHALSSLSVFGSMVVALVVMVLEF